MQLAGLFGASRWLKLKSTNFELLTAGDEKKGRNLILHFERVRSFFVSTMPTLQGTLFPVRIVGFDSDKEYDDYRPNESATAFYAGGSNGDYIVMKDVSASGYPVAIHEYVHLLVRHTGLNWPLWYKEGLADLFSNLKPVGDEVEIGDMIADRYDLLKRQPLLDLAVIMGADRESPLYDEKNKAAMFYAESWALVHMLNLSELYQPHLNDLKKMLPAGASPAELFGRVYAKTPAQVQRDLETYLRRTAFNAVRFSIRLEKSVETPDVAPATDLEVQVALANVSMDIEKGSRARQILEGLSLQYPDRWEVEEALGYVNWYAGKREEARVHLGRAVQLGTTNAGTYLDYAGLMRDTGASGSTLMPIVEKALQLRPESRDAHLTLASLFLDEGMFSQALSHLIAIRGTVRADDAHRMFRLLAYTYLGLGEIDNATKSAEGARTYARTKSEVAETQSLFRSLAERQRDATPPKPAPALPPASTVFTPLPADPEPQVLQIKGRLRRFDCLDKKARLIIEADGKQVALLILDPARVTIKGQKGVTVAFDCGPQPGTPVVVTYIPKPDAQSGTVGQVVIIDFP